MTENIDPWILHRRLMKWTQLELYASRDDGLTWEFVSHVARGGEALPNNVSDNSHHKIDI
jgi:hypothetical protein